MVSSSRQDLAGNAFVEIAVPNIEHFSCSSISSSGAWAAQKVIGSRCAAVLVLHRIVSVMSDHYREIFHKARCRVLLIVVCLEMNKNVDLTVLALASIAIGIHPIVCLSSAPGLAQRSQPSSIRLRL